MRTLIIYFSGKAGFSQTKKCYIFRPLIKNGIGKYEGVNLKKMAWQYMKSMKGSDIILIEDMQFDDIDGIYQKDDNFYPLMISKKSDPEMGDIHHL